MKTVDVLIVEDNEWLARQYSRVLKNAGFSSSHVMHTISAIDHIDEIRPKMILLDMLLTVATGMTLLHELQSHDDLAQIPVVVVTTLAEQFDYEALRPYGVVELLDKTTMHPEDIVAAVRRLLT